MDANTLVIGTLGLVAVSSVIGLPLTIAAVSLVLWTVCLV